MDADPDTVPAFDQLVRALGRGPSRSRHLTRAEAESAMARMLSGEAAPEAVGAMLMLMRYRGENAEEIAGFADAMRARAAGWRALAPVMAGGLDWGSYAAGRTRGAPWFLLAALLVARAGVPVFLHGFNSHMSHPLHTAAAAEALGLPIVDSPEAARAALETRGIAYAPLAAIDPEILRLLNLRAVFGLRSPVNTTLKLFNPAGAPAAVQGVFHPSYRALQQEAASLLGLRALIAVKGAGGEAERTPAKAQELYRLSDGRIFEETAPPMLDVAPRRHGEAPPSVESFLALWRGAERDAYAEAAAIGTAALGLLAAGRAADLAEAETLARGLWEDRR